MLNDFTIVIPSFNHEKYLPNLLSRLEKLVELGIKLLIIDDASTDNSSKIINIFLQNHRGNSNISYLVKEKNFGLVDSLKTALILCETKYIYIIASDDNICIDNFIKASKIVYKNNKRFYIFGAINLFNNGKSSNVYSKKHIYFFNHLTPIERGNLIFYNHPAPILLQSTIFETSLLREINAFNDNLKFDDYPIFIKIFGIKKYNSFLFIPDLVISEYRHHEINTYKNYKKMFLMFIEVYDNLCPEKLYDISASQIWWLYFFRIIRDKKLRLLPFFLKHFKINYIRYLCYFLFMRNKNEL